MLTNALQEILFVSALLLWPFTIPVLLFLLICVLFLFANMVKNWEKKSVRRTAGIVGVCALILVVALVRESAPYSASSAKWLYTSHRNAYDTVATFMLEQAREDGGRAHYSNGTREKWPEEIEAELGKVLGNWSLRCGSPDVFISSRGCSDDLEVLFYIYIGPEYGSGDGGMMCDVQYLAFVPGGCPSPYRENLTHLTGDWYLYTDNNM